MKTKLLLISILFLSLNVFAKLPVDGLMRFYPLENGFALDNSPFKKTGKVVGAKPINDRFGKKYFAMAINSATKNYITIPADGLNSDEYTYSAWVFIYTQPGFNERYAVLSIGSGDRVQQLTYNHKYNLPGTPQFLGWGVHACTETKIDTAYTNKLALFKTWQHVVLVKSKTNLKFYVDNVLIKSIETTEKPSYGMGELKAIIGASVTNSMYFNGIIDDVRIYNKALDDLEIKELYEDGNWLRYLIK